MSDWLKMRLGHERPKPIPCGLQQINDYVRDATYLFAGFFVNAKVRLVLREGPDRPGIKRSEDKRRMAGLTRDGRRAWEEAQNFLRKHDPAYRTYAHQLAAPP